MQTTHWLLFEKIPNCFFHLIHIVGCAFLYVCCIVFCIPPSAIWTRIFMHILQLHVFSSFIHISWHMQYASKYCLLVPQTIVALYIRRSTFLSQHMKIYEILALHLGHSGTLPVASCSCVKTINRKTRKRNQILDVTLIIGRSAYYNTFEPWHNGTAPKSYSHMPLTFHVSREQPNQ